jgi:sugar/nucleoside kinase (ribokinase family)
MPDVLIVGTVATDTIETPFGKVNRALGGSATYSSFACSFFASPAIVSVIGTDFPREYLELLKSRKIATDGIQVTGKTFHWEGFYEFDMNEAKTRKTELNSLAGFKVSIPEKYRDIEYVFLANLDPEQQIETLRQMKKPKFVMLDTMNFWISSQREKVLEAISKCNLLVFNEGEARQLFKTASLAAAANEALKLGPSAVIIKKGEHGSLLFTKTKHNENSKNFRGDRKSVNFRHFNAPGYPLETIKDPTGCGDSFGGALIGYLAKTKDTSEKNLRKAVVYGSVVASFNAEDFSLNRQKTISMKDIEKRYREFEEMREF